MGITPTIQSKGTPERKTAEEGGHAGASDWQCAFGHLG